jgi:hypothetical protein
VQGLKDLGAIEGQLREHLASLAAESTDGEECVMAVWPELTLPPQLVELIRTTLGDRGLSDNPGARPGFVVAGSWHVEADGGHVNLTPILDGSGNPLFAYRKTSRFELSKTGFDAEASGGSKVRLPEDILLGEELPILVYGDLLIAFAICLDFCDQSKDPPYHDMAVDLVIVPSYGNEAMMKGHIQTATAIKARHDALSFVVQQAFPALAAGGGYVLPAPVKVTAFDVPKCVEGKLWRTHGLRMR